MARPKLIKTLTANNKVFIDIVLGNDVIGGFLIEDEYIDFSKPLSERQVLAVISQAFTAGFEQGVVESRDAVLRVICKNTHAPLSKISETDDYREKTK